MEKRIVLFVFGTRPEAIKMAPVIREFQRAKEIFDAKVCVTAQHRHMLDQVLKFFKIKPDFDLDLMRPNQSLTELTINILREVKIVLEEVKPDFVFVHGDTTTTFASSLASFYHGSKVCHIEAGLRTWNKFSPFPEEINRTLTARLTDIHFAPTVRAKENLLKEGVSDKDIFVTGNTVIDALLIGLEELKQTNHEAINYLNSILDFNKDIILITGHRRENFGEGFKEICEAIRVLAEEFPEKQFVYPVHLNPNVLIPVNTFLSDIDNIFLIEPLDYEPFIWLMSRSKLILTDSGGIQEEAPSLGKPVLVMRDTTERPEAVDAGTVILVGTSSNRIISEAKKLLTNEGDYNAMSKRHNPYGDGSAALKIHEILLLRK
jgi:UDP-N-acetylglucosamine 2-epimerase (non-hydrolysing)